ncbi:hypothetical protein [Aestuariibacter salexigens]|uniref:hypothetical protein n=1 Tax=Aestuariibacter salexigens TaxID=226010 RepID=UPI000419EC98|nr:hypothetical protein [Aestuariibacter salexigens]
MTDKSKTSMHQFRFFICFTLIFFLGNAKHLFAKPFEIAVNDSYSAKVGKSEITALFAHMYAPLGITPTVNFYPSRRGLQLANEGLLDAEAGRIPDVISLYPNLIAVPEYMIEHQGAFFCKDARLCKKQKDHAYAIIRGYRGGKSYCESQRLICLFDATPDFLRSALVNGAIDAIIGSKTTTLNLLCESGIRTVYFRNEERLKLASYHVLHKRHEDKIDLLAKSIKDMREQGVFDAFVAKSSALPEGCVIELIDTSSLK